MSFLRLGALWALPLVLIPIVVHLIHRRRHPTMAWPAMMFLRRASQARRGPAKLRRWLVLALRMMVIAAVIFALARPLSSGRLGVAASRVVSGATTIVLLDRSPSLQRRVSGGQTRQVAGLESIASTLKTLGAGGIVLIDSVAMTPVELSGPNALLQQSVTDAADSTADIAGMMRLAIQYLHENDRRVADVWVCSDNRAGDWYPKSPQWQQVAQQVTELGDGVRFYRLSFPFDQRINSAVVITSVRPTQAGQGRGLVISIRVVRDDSASAVVPVRISVGGVTSTVDVNVVDGVGELVDVSVKDSGGAGELYGRVSIPADVNAADDQFYFSSSPGKNRPIGLVTDSTCDALEVVSDIFGRVEFHVDGDVNAAKRLNAAKRPGERLESVEQRLQEVACLVWQGQLPSGKDADRVQKFVARGGSVVFFPPEDKIESIEFQGVGWGQWTIDKGQSATFDDWGFSVGRSCSIDGDLLALSTIENGDRLIGKKSVGRGSVWFCGTDVTDRDSLFVQDGLALYGLFFEALSGSQLHSDGDGQITAGEIDLPQSPASLTSILLNSDGADGVTEFGHHAGVFLIKQSEHSPGRRIVINRSVAESDRTEISDQQLQRLVPGIRWNQVMMDASEGKSSGGFVREMWAAIWMMVIAGMLLESWLSLPSRSLPRLAPKKPAKAIRSGAVR